MPEQRAPSASQLVADYLRDGMQGGAWTVGEKIPSEHDLSRRLGVSRVSVRLAIQQFIALGVLESVKGKGTFLREALPAPGGGAALPGFEHCRDIEKVLQFRAILEPEACFLAARANADISGRLRRILHAMVESIGAADRFVANDIQFHLAIAEASGNPLIAGALSQAFTQTGSDHRRMNEIFGYKDGVYYHSLLLKAFEAGDAALARTLMAEHLGQALERVRLPQEGENRRAAPKRNRKG